MFNSNVPNLPEFPNILKLVVDLAEVVEDIALNEHSKTISFAIQMNKEISPKTWEEYIQGRKSQTIYILPPGVSYGEKPPIEWEVKAFAETKHKRTRYTEIPKYIIDEFGNRMSRSCSNNLRDTQTTFKTIAFFGCSFTFGDSIEADDIYINKVVDGLAQSKNQPILGYNLAYGGNSIESIQQQFSAITSLRTFDYAFFLLPTIDRFNIIDQGTNGDVAGKIFADMPVEFATYKKQAIIPRWNDKSKKRVAMKAESLNELEQIYETVENVKSISLTCKLKNIKPIFSAWDRETYAIIAATIDDPDLQLAPFFDMPERDKDPLDFGVDGGHPGPIAHDKFAIKVINWIHGRSI